MTTTATFLQDPNLAAFADEAIERAGLDLQEIGGQHLISIRRSAGLMLSSWANRGHRQWKFTQIAHNPAVIGENVFDLPTGTIFVQTAVLRRDDTDTEMYLISREDYLILHDKTLLGRPDRYHIDRRRDTEAGTLPRMFYWQAAERTSDQIVFNAYLQIEDPGNAQNTLDVPFRFQEAFAADLAARIAQKWKPERFVELKQIAELEWNLAKDEDRDPAPLVITVAYDRFYGRR